METYSMKLDLNIDAKQLKITVLETKKYHF